MRMHIYLLILCLFGCGTGPEKPGDQAVIVQTVPGPVIKQIITLDKKLTADCRKVRKEDIPPGLPFEEAAIWLANERKKANDECNERMRKIREQQKQLEK